MNGALVADLERLRRLRAIEAINARVDALLVRLFNVCQLTDAELDELARLDAQLLALDQEAA